MARPLLLDLFCGAGGAGMGYHQAGFNLIGVDLHPQPRYPFAFIPGDALDMLWRLAPYVDAVHASPPCQAHTALRTMHNAKAHDDLIGQTRDALRLLGKPYVLENVVGAPLEDPFLLCGTMFGLGVEGAELHRHRIFESNCVRLELACQHGREPNVLGIYGGHVRNRKRRPGSHARGVADFTPRQGKQAMGVDWMTLAELSQAIPPAYTHAVGNELWCALKQKRRAA